ncbi:hypothetical protein D9M70_377430 [compost metagenome]
MLVAGHDAVEGLVHHVGHLAQLVGVARDPGPGVMDHEQGVVGHLDPVRPAHSHAAGTETGTVDATGATLPEAAQDVVNGDAGEEISAHGVEAHQHLGHTIILGLEILDEVAGGHPPHADLAVDEDLDHLAGAFAQGADVVPVFGLQLGQPGGLVEDPGSSQGTDAQATQHQRQGQFQVVLHHGVSSFSPGGSSARWVSVV